MGIRKLAAIVTSSAKMTKSTLIFVALLGLCCGAPPLDVSEFFATPTSNPEEAQTAPVPESKARLGSAPDLSELLAQLGGDQNNALRALATMLGNPQQPDSNEDANDLLSYFGQPDLEKEPEDIITDATVNCRTNSLSKADCEEHKQCHWLAKSKHEGKCIHQTERLYNALYKKLNKRGKKDIAIQVFYNSRPAKVKTPHGLHGPQIVGAFNHLHKLQPYYKPIGYNSYLNSYGFGGYNHYGFGGNRGYGHGGYGHNNGGYGHDDGGYDNKNDTSSHDNGGYEQDNSGYGNDNGGYGQENYGYGHDNGGYGQDKGGYGHSNGGYSHEHNGYGQGYGGYGHGNGRHGHSYGGHGHSHGGYGHNNGGYGGHSYGNGGYGHDNGGYGGGHGHSEYLGPSYGHQGHSAGYSAGPTTYGSKGHGGYE